MGSYLPDPPVANITIENDKKSYFIGEKIQLTGKGSTGSGIIFRWDLDGDGEWDAYGEEYEHRFDEPGRHLVRLEVVDRYNNTASDELYVTVEEKKDYTSSLFNVVLLILRVLAVLVILESFSSKILLMIFFSINCISSFKFIFLGLPRAQPKDIGMYK